MIRTLRIATGAAALVLTATASLAAQQGAGRAPAGPARQMPQADRMPDMPRGPMGNTPAAHLLQMREHLKLTDDQAKRLEALNTAQAQALAPQRGAALRVAADLSDATQGDGNIAAARAAMEKGAKLHIDQAIAHLQAMKDARAVLTTDQKAQMDAMGPMMGAGRMGGMGMRGGRGGMMGGQGMHGHPGMMGGPGMQGHPGQMGTQGQGPQRMPGGQGQAGPPRPPQDELDRRP